MPKIPFDDDDGRFEPAEPPELSEAAKQALARQQKLDDGNFITERTLAFQRDMAAEFARAKRDGDAGDPMFVKDLMKVASEMRSEHLSDIRRGPGGRLISQDAIDLTRANMEGAMERFSTAALHRLNLERHQRAFANIGAAGAEIAAAAKRDARGLSGLLSTVDDLMGQFEGVFAAHEAAEQRARLRAGTVTAAVDGLIERGATGDARALIQKGGFDSDLGPKPARLLLGRIDKTEKDNARNAAKQADKANTVAVADLDFRVATGQAFREELDFELEQGTIGAEEHADFMAELEQQDEDSTRRADGTARVNDKLARREKPDAGDPADRAAVDVLFEGLAEAIAGRPPEEQAFIETRFVRRTGMLPAALRDDLTAGMFSEDPAAQVAAAGRLVALEDADPAVTADIPADILDRARTITAFAYPGLTPARIVQLADERLARQKAQAEDEGIKGDGDDSPDVPEDEPEFEVLDEPEAMSPGAAGDSQDRAVIVIRNPQTGEVQEVTEAQLEELIGLAEDPETKTEDPSDDTATEIAELVLSVLPGTGEVLAARDSYLAFRAAQEALENDDLQEALLKGGESALNALGAIPILGGVIRAPKAVAKAASLLVKLLGRAKRMTRIGGRRKLTIDELEGVIPPTRNFPKGVDKEISELVAKRDEIRAQRLKAPKGSTQRAQLLKKQKGEEMRFGHISGEAYPPQIEEFLTSRGIRVLARKTRKNTPKGGTEIDLQIVDHRGSGGLAEVKLKHSRDRRPQTERQEFVAESMGMTRIVIREGKPIRITRLPPPPKGGSLSKKSSLKNPSPGHKKRRPK